MIAGQETWATSSPLPQQNSRCFHGLDWSAQPSLGSRLGCAPHATARLPRATFLGALHFDFNLHSASQLPDNTSRPPFSAPSIRIPCGVLPGIQRASCLAITRTCLFLIPPPSYGRALANWYAQSAISSCAASSPASPSAASATSATANAQSATPTSDPRPSSAFAMNAASATTRTSVSCAVVRAYRTLSTASSARDWRRTATDAPRLLISEVRGRT